MSQLPCAQDHCRAVFLLKLRAVPVFNGYYDFPSRMSFFQVTDSVSRLAQRITSIDDRYHFSGFKKIFQNNQILLVYLGYEETHLLAPNP